MNAADKNALLLMKAIINDYLDGRIDRENAANKVFNDVDLDVIYRVDSEPIVTDCYYSIKHLTEPGYETTDFEISYFRNCLNGIIEYSEDEKVKLTREYLNKLDG